MSQSPPEAEAIAAEEPPEEVTAPEVVPGLLVVDLSQNAQPESSGAADDKPRGRHHKQTQEDSKPPATGIPTADEWQDFLGGTVLRLLTEGYLYMVLFKDIDETDLTPRERDLVRLTKDDLREMASPMASFAYKNKHARKHGRTIIAAAESYESLIDLLIWMRRVNKIARKYRKNEPQAEMEQGNGPVSVTDNGTRPSSGPVGPVTGPVIYNPGTG
jgi:hypothetical protein